jgi:hypothetical protein
VYCAGWTDCSNITSAACLNKTTPGRLKLVIRNQPTVSQFNSAHVFTRSFSINRIALFNAWDGQQGDWLDIQYRWRRRYDDDDKFLRRLVRHIAQMEAEIDVYRVLVRKLEGKKLLERPMHRWKY